MQTVYEGGSRHLAPLDRQAFEDTQRFASAQQRNWFEALRIYSEHYTHQDFVFSETMVRIDNVLTSSGENSKLSSLRLPPLLTEALNLAAEPYRTVQWPRDNARNQEFIVGLEKILLRFGPEIATRLAHLYRTSWLREPIRVDVMPYAQSEGSYSNNADSFVHIAMSTADTEEQGLSGLDVLFHEASHSIADPRYGSIGGAITAAARRANRPVPSQLWHTVIMYTPGKLAETIFNRAGLGPYTMFAKRDGLFTHVWPRYFHVLVKYWQPYMDGSGTLEGALTKCVNAIVAVEP